jgi:Zn-dependent peptidase ImmA (M78 family)
VIFGCAEPESPVAQQAVVTLAERNQYQSPFSGYKISLNKLTELSRMTFDEAVVHLEKHEGVYVFRLGMDHPELSEHDERILQRGLEVSKAEARYFPPGSRVNAGLTVNETKLAERDDPARAIIVMKAEVRDSFILTHEYGHHLFLNSRDEQRVIRNGKEYNQRDARLEEARDLTLQAATVLNKAIAEKDDSRETRLIYSKLYVKAELAAMRNKVIVRRDELDILSLQLRHYRELGTRPAELDAIESYYLKQIELLKETIQYFGEEDEVLIQLRESRFDGDKELTDLYDQLRSSVQEGVDLGNAAMRFYREWSK